MATSLPHGKSSCTALRSEAEIRSALTALTLKDPLAPLIAALGRDAELHLVGGTVRDVATGAIPADYDLATNLSAESVLQRLHASSIHALDVGMRHGTIIAVIDGHNIEITTFRKVTPNGAVQVGSSIADDLVGRDFTINAIAFNITSKQIVDPTQGLSDLSSQTIRAPGDPLARFQEDPLRLLRMLRFGPCACRQIDLATSEAARQSFARISGISAERIKAELEKILLSENPSAGLRALQSYGGLEHIIPEALPSIGVEQNEFHVEDVFDHTLTVIERCPRDAVLRWAALFHDLGKPATLTIGEDGRRHFYGHEKVSTTLAHQAMERLKFSNDDRQNIALIVREHMRPIDCGAPGTRRILRDLGEQYARWRLFKAADSPPIMTDAEMQLRFERFDTQVEAERSRPKGSVFESLAINGNDLIALGLSPGPRLGEILKAAHEAVLDTPELNEKSQLLEFAKKMISNS
jgi:tRNA nucleotidyltransferase (CCA-adding enzyme)